MFKILGSIPVIPGLKLDFWVLLTPSSYGVSLDSIYQTTSISMPRPAILGGLFWLQGVIKVCRPHTSATLRRSPRTQCCGSLGITPSHIPHSLCGINSFHCRAGPKLFESDVYLAQIPAKMKISLLQEFHNLVPIIESFKPSAVKKVQILCLLLSFICFFFRPCTI